MPNPSDWKHHKVTEPKNDSEYLERMSRVILASGLNWQVLEKKWPGIVKAYDNFDVDKVSKYLEPEIDDLMNNPDVIRNLAKIRAIVANAKTVKELSKENSSFAMYLDSLSKHGEDEMRATLSKQFAFLGKGTTVIFLFAVGIDQPKAMEQWQKRHAS